MVGCGGGSEPPPTPDVSNPILADYDDTTVTRAIISAEIAATDGGTIEVTDTASPLHGVKVVIPPAALSANRTITLSEVDNPPALPEGMNYIGMPLDLSPDGLSFQKEITITLPYTDAELHDAGVSDDATLQVWSYDKIAGTWEKATIVNIDTAHNIITVRSSHFSIFAHTVFNAAPPANLGLPQPGDLLYKTGTVIGENHATGWRPGHVGIYTGEKVYPGTGLATDVVLLFGRYNVVEAIRTGVQYAYYDIPNVGETDEAALGSFNSTDIYMGAREPLSASLTPAQRATVVAFAEAQVGKSYAWNPTTVGPAHGELAGGQAKGPERFNCVGLVEKAYEAAGVNSGEGLVAANEESVLLTPAEQYNQTRPSGGEAPTPKIVSATITPSSGTECTIILLEIGVTHNYGLKYVASVTYKAENGFTNPTLDINDRGSQGDRVAGDGIYSVEANAGTGVGKPTVRIDFTLNDLYGKTDTANVTYTFTGTCKPKKGIANFGTKSVDAVNTALTSSSP